MDNAGALHLQQQGIVARAADFQREVDRRGAAPVVDRSNGDTGSGRDGSGDAVAEHGAASPPVAAGHYAGVDPSKLSSALAQAQSWKESASGQWYCSCWCTSTTSILTAGHREAGKGGDGSGTVTPATLQPGGPPKLDFSKLSEARDLPVVQDSVPVTAKTVQSQATAAYESNEAVAACLLCLRRATNRGALVLLPPHTRSHASGKTGLSISVPATGAAASPLRSALSARHCT